MDENPLISSDSSVISPVCKPKRLEEYSSMISRKFRKVALDARKKRVRLPHMEMPFLSPRIASAEVPRWSDDLCLGRWCSGQTRAAAPAREPDPFHPSLAKPRLGHGCSVGRRLKTDLSVF